MVSLDVTAPEAPSSDSFMSSLYVVFPLTTLPDSRTVAAWSAAASVRFLICSAGSLPTPFVPASGSSPHPVSPVAVTTSPAHSAPASAVLRVRPRGVAVTGGVPLV